VHKRLLPLERKTSPLTVKPPICPRARTGLSRSLLAEFDSVNGRGTATCANPAFLSLREDKKAREVVLDSRAGTALPT
jgi:hypothetical protein